MPSDHHPPHLYLDDTWYMITGSIYGGRHLLAPSGHKEVVRDQLKALVLRYGVELAAWVILDNHYHLLMKSRVGADLPQLLGRLHGATSFILNKRDGTHGRQMWHNYFDTCIRTERGHWLHFNYIHHNPVKHGYVSNCGDWPFSSYTFYLRTKGERWLADLFGLYPTVDYTNAADVKVINMERDSSL